MPINKKIHSIMSQLDKIPKTGVGPQSMGKYPFMKVEDIAEAVRPLMVAEGVVVRTEIIDAHHDFQHGTPTFSMDGKEIGDGRVRAIRVNQRVTVRFSFIDSDDDSEFDVTTMGEAMDVQDKATRKAITQAWKVALMQTFVVLDGEPDSDGIAPSDAIDETPAKPKQDRGAQARTTARNTPAKPAAKEEPKPVATQTPVEAAKEAPAAPAAEPAADGSPWISTPEEAAEVTPKPKPEPSPGAVENTPDALAKAKNRLRAAVADAGGMTKDAVDEIGLAETEKTREEWITLSSAINKIAAEIERRTALTNAGEEV